MTVSSEVSSVSHAGDGVSTAFTVPFRFLSPNDLQVRRRNADGSVTLLTTGFSITGGDPTGLVTFDAAPEAGTDIIIDRAPQLLQPAAYPSNDKFPAATHEMALDRLTYQTQWLRRQLEYTLRFPFADGSAGIELPSAPNRASKYLAFDADGNPEVADLVEGTITRSIIGGLLYPQTPAEALAGVTPVDYAIEPGFVTRYGADPTGTNDSTAAIQAAIDVGGDVIFPGGTYLANNLTQSANFQKLTARGWVRIKKNANGPLFTSTGDDVELNGIGFSGDYAANAYTGHNVVMSGENPRLINCGSRDTPGRALLCTGNHVQVVGTCDIYSTSTPSGYDIEIGLSGTTRLYHRVTGIKTSQAAGGILFTDCGGQLVSGCQFGKLTIASSSVPGPAGANGGAYVGNRILGDVSVDLSNSNFDSNLFGAITITLASGTSGHRFGASNGYDAGCVLVDNSNESTLIDTREMSRKTYTPVWTAASANPVIGNGSIKGYYYEIGKLVFAEIAVTIGSTTTFGTGTWAFSLPSVPHATFRQAGAAYVRTGGAFKAAAVATLHTGAASCNLIVAGENSFADATRPNSWANGDEIVMSIVYLKV